MAIVHANRDIASFNSFANGQEAITDSPRAHEHNKDQGKGIASCPQCPVRDFRYSCTFDRLPSRDWIVRTDNIPNCAPCIDLQRVRATTVKTNDSRILNPPSNVLVQTLVKSLGRFRHERPELSFCNHVTPQTNAGCRTPYSRADAAESKPACKKLS